MTKNKLMKQEPSCDAPENKLALPVGCSLPASVAKSAAIPAMHNRCSAGWPSAVLAYLLSVQDTAAAHKVHAMLSEVIGWAWELFRGGAWAAGSETPLGLRLGLAGKGMAAAVPEPVTGNAESTAKNPAMEHMSAANAAGTADVGRATALATAAKLTLPPT
eukprot:CAMPEP_0119114308 /NCGR_PEP_ID=MMETSP1180-20130426/47066_1 /TAXON_ID=3052 ORGANISM="Chlamydomonas cf sp, Strain CCMP681" /NCGR_SAMPLE_ID=MMETSP1180 /ASSEMBLY_ACC=CAM_ASM_000741 /LENGTH=160 /DNA_ID=CAMNT_0007102783 /DNA_START=631 /DNA_END=1113 /DNA_ORIENTATION=-